MSVTTRRERIKSNLSLMIRHVLQVRVCSSSCTDACWAGPIVAIAPDGVFYGRVTEADVDEIVTALEKGELVSRLVLPASDFDQATAGPMLPEEPKPRAAESGEPKPPT